MSILMHSVQWAIVDIWIAKEISTTISSLSNYKENTIRLLLPILLQILIFFSTCGPAPVCDTILSTTNNQICNRKTDLSAAYCLGKYTAPTVKEITGGLALKYEGTKNAPNCEGIDITTTINVLCDTTVDTITISVLNESSTCQYKFIFS
ncbi:hypothetical protein PPL_07815 [Heterostelium album PN500]|uniref:MRH domain-containing protein n=1 Tax=Heterostelium pallidum (strain ATCC 26659 / Pp 5 / PN500) TaxID=670386 RepID=D3BH13_HETP5|nr:hypothetical protein PPL_07815 [Heterostelium album PN500]EFA79397.1 hypothetical protein PPL_07815 [Heterostelium album PN500]|eukprot:XP_020431518.1 hypothetical protein PPL_07815 [Heterostelium album PN500]